MSTATGKSPVSLGWYLTYEWRTFADVGSISYTVDNSATAPAFTRVLYQMVFGDYSVWCEFDDFTSGDATKVGIPQTWVYESDVTNLTVWYSKNAYGYLGANTSTIYNRSSVSGRINFWPSNYGTAADGLYDSDDDGYGTSNGYGSLQVFDTTPSPDECIFAWNYWGTSAADFGMGNRNTSNPDWTFAANVAYVSGRLGRVYVK